MTDLEGSRPYWQQKPKILIPYLVGKEDKYTWSYTPFNLSRSGEPFSSLQQKIFDDLVGRLTSPALDNTLVPLPGKDAQPEMFSKMIVMFGGGEWDWLNHSSFPLYLSLRHQKPLLFYLNTVKRFPQNIDFHVARKQLVRGACHNGVIFEGNPYKNSIGRALWMSMQGNYAIIEGSQDEIFDEVIFRTLNHYGADFVTEREDYQEEDGRPWLPWKEWAESSHHRENWHAAQDLFEQHLIEDEVNLRRYAPYYFIRLLMIAINKSAIGESMRGQYLPDLGVYVVTPSGGKKVKWNPDPIDGHLTPVSHITKNGYVVPIPGGRNVVIEGRGKPIKYADGSVETFENLQVVIALQMAKKYGIKTYQAFMSWLNDQFNLHGKIPVKQSDLKADITIDHAHVHEDEESVNTDLLEIVTPDPDVVPDTDVPCGSRNGAKALLSALFLSENFIQSASDEHPLNGKVIGVKLAGHGMVFVGENRQSVTSAMLRGMKAKEPRWV